MTIPETLDYGTAQLPYSSSAHLDAELLLLHTLHKENRTWLIAHGGENVSDDDHKTFTEYIHKRAQGVPVAYITNKKAFYGRDFYVDERVLIPRPETEQLVELTLTQLTTNNKQQTTLIDVGTGSGIIPITIYKELEARSQKLEACYAIDLASDALEVAKHNATSFGVDTNITFLQGNLLEPLINNSLLIINNAHIVITANLPYVSEHEYQENIHNLKHEPYIALVAEHNGMREIEELLTQVKKMSTNNVTLILEHGYQHKESLHACAHEYFPTAHIETHKDISGKDRITAILLN